MEVTYLGKPKELKDDSKQISDMRFQTCVYCVQKNVSHEKNVITRKSQIHFLRLALHVTIFT